MSVVTVVLWVVQVTLGAVFGFSALVRGTQSRQRAVQLGMTGVVNVPLPIMRFTAGCELLGVIGLFVPMLTGVAPVLTPLAALGLAVIMVCAAIIHLGLKEKVTAGGNLILLGMCLFVAWGRWPH